MSVDQNNLAGAEAVQSGIPAPGEGPRPGVPDGESRRAMARRAREAPAAGPGGDGVLPPAEQLKAGGGAELPPAWPEGESVEKIRARMRPYGETTANPGTGP